MDGHAQEFLRQHDDMITCIAVSPSGRYIASGQKGENSDIYIWDYESRKVIYKLQEHDFSVQDIAFSEDEMVFASIGHQDDGNLIVWDMSNGCIIASASKIAQGTLCLSFAGFVKDIKRRSTSHYQLCTAGSDGIVMWDLDPRSGDLLHLKLTGEARATITRIVTAVSFSDDRETLYGATTSGDFVIGSIRVNKIAQVVQATKMRLNAILYHEGGVVIGCGDGTVKIYGHGGDFRGEMPLDGPVVSLSASPDRRECLATTATGTVARVNLTSLQSILIAESHTDSILKVAFDEGQNERFATASMDGTLKVWDIVEYAVVSTSHARREQDRGAVPQCLAFANILISGWSDGRIVANSAETGESLWLLDNAHPGGVTALCLSHNRRFVLSGGPSGEVRLWELRSRELISHLKEHKQKVTCLALFDDDTLCVSGCRDRCLLRWDLKTEMRMHCHMQRMGGINGMALTVGGQTHTVSVGQDRRITVWDNHTNEPLLQMFLDDENDEGLAMAISHDGKMVATGGTMGVMRLFRLQLSPVVALHRSAEVRGHSKSITSLAFSLDDKQIVSVGEDGGIFVWSVYA